MGHRIRKHGGRLPKLRRGNRPPLPWHEKKGGSPYTLIQDQVNRYSLQDSSGRTLRRYYHLLEGIRRVFSLDASKFLTLSETGQVELRYVPGYLR